MSTLQTCARCTMTSGTMAPDVMGIIVHVSADDCIAAVEDDRQILEHKVRELERERDAATQRLSNLLEGCRALARTLDVHDEITLHDYLAGDDVEDLKQRIVMSHGDEPYYDVANIEELLLREAASMRECDALIALSRSGVTGDAMIAPTLVAKGEAEAWLEAALAAATPDHVGDANDMGNSSGISNSSPAQGGHGDGL